MPTTVVTGRQRTLTVSGTLEMRRYGKLVPGIAPDAGELRSAGADFSLNVYWSYPTIHASVSMVDSPTGGKEMGWECEAADGLGGSDSEDNYAIAPGGPTWEFDSSFSGGSYSLTLDVEEVFEVDDLDASMCDADGFPLEPQISIVDGVSVDGYGSGHADGIRGRLIRVYERARIGGYSTATITGGGVSATTSTIIASNFEVDYDYVLWTLSSSAFHTTGHTRTTISWDDLEVTPAYSKSNSRGNCIANGRAFVAESFSVDSDVSSSINSLTVLGGPTCEYQAVGTVGIFDQPYPSAIAARVQYKIDGANLITQRMSLPGSLNIKQRAYTCGSVVDSATQPGLSIYEKAPVRIWADVDDLTDLGEDVRDWRMQFLGRSWDAFSPNFDLAYEIDDADSANWTAGANTTDSGSNPLVLAVAGGTGSATRTFSPEQNSEAYRYLKVPIRSTVGANQPFTVGIQGETWDFTTGAANTWVYRYVDLCCSGSESDDVEPRDTRFPIDGPADPTADLTSDGYALGWGVDWMASVALTNLADGETYEVGKMELSRGPTPHDAYVSYVPGFKRRHLGWTSGSDNTYLYPYAFQFSEGRMTDIGVHMAFVDAFAGADSYVWYSITDLATWFSYPAGWTSGSAGSGPDAYHDNDLEAIHAGAGGLTYDYTTRRWENWTWVLEDTTVTGQGLFDQVRTYPGCGPGIWTGAGYTTDRKVPIAAGKLLRGQWDGIVFDEDGIPISAVTVTTDPNGGTGATNAAGFYRTTSPYGFGNDSYDVEWNALSQTDTQANRSRNRTGFRKAVSRPGSPLSYDVSDGMRHLLARGVGGNVTIDRRDNRVGTPDSTATGIPADQLCLRFDQGSGRLWLWTASGGALEAQYSEDEGKTFSVATSIGSTTAAGYHGACIDRDGNRYVFRVTGSGPYAATGKIYDRSGNLIGSEFTAVSGIDNASISADYSARPGGERTIVLWVTEGGILKAYTSPDGRTFS